MMKFGIRMSERKLTFRTESVSGMTTRTRASTTTRPGPMIVLKDRKTVPRIARYPGCTSLFTAVALSVTKPPISISRVSSSIPQVSSANNRPGVESRKPAALALLRETNPRQANSRPANHQNSGNNTKN